jgi:molybdate transport system substrate-binding protein
MQLSVKNKHFLLFLLAYDRSSIGGFSVHRSLVTLRQRPDSKKSLRSMKSPTRFKLFSFLMLLALSVGRVEANHELLIYTGITMVRPIAELAARFETKEKIKIQIIQGASEDIYQSARKSRLGDIYFPGEPSFREKYLSEGLFGYHRLVGFNQIALFVQKGNPKKVQPKLTELLRKDIAVLIGNTDSGSIGLETKQTLDRFKLYDKVVTNAAFMMPDSRSINASLKKGEADLALNWRATAFFPDNKPFMDIVDLDPSIAELQALLLIQLTFSKKPELARKFIDYVASPEGQLVFRNYGFVDAEGKR